MIGAYTHGGGSASTGTLTRGRNWSLSGTATITPGIGGGLGGSVNGDGSFTGSYEATMGAAAGVAAKVCSKKVRNYCTG